MFRVFPALAVVALLLATPAAPFAAEPASEAAPAAAEPTWVGALVVDRKGRDVGPIDRLVRNGKGRNAEIIVNGSRTSVPLKTLSFREDGKVVSSMTRAEISVTYPGCAC